WVQRPDPFRPAFEGTPVPGRRPAGGTLAEQPLADRVDEALRAHGDAPVTIASLARELGVKKSEIRAALRTDAASRADAGAGPRAQVVRDEGGTGWVQRPNRDGAGDRGEAPSNPRGPRQQQPDGLPAGSSLHG